MSSVPVCNLTVTQVACSVWPATGCVVRLGQMSTTLLVLLTLLMCQAAAQYSSPTQLPLDLIELPDGFSISLYTTTAVLQARQLALSQGQATNLNNAQVVYVGSLGSEVSFPGFHHCLSHLFFGTECSRWISGASTKVYRLLGVCF